MNVVFMIGSGLSCSIVILAHRAIESLGNKRQDLFLRSLSMLFGSAYKFFLRKPAQYVVDLAVP